MSSLIIRQATVDDVETIEMFIRALAEYENLLDQVEADAALLKESLFEKKAAEVVIAELDKQPVGFALYFQNFSTFTGKSGIYLEDLFVLKAYRGLKVGKKLFEHIAGIAVERSCGRFEWSCLDWNEPSIAFYEHMGAKPMSDWTIYRVTGEQIQRIATGKA